MLLACMLLAAVTFAFAENSFAEVSGQEPQATDNLYEISSADQLEQLFDAVRDGNLEGSLQVKLTGDITTDKGFSYYTVKEDNDLVVDLNGHSITVSNANLLEDTVLSFYGPVDVRITGNGHLAATSAAQDTFPKAIAVNDASVTIENGTFEAKRPVSVATDLEGEKAGSLTINGGSFIGEVPLTTYGGNITVNDGIFQCVRYPYEDSSADYKNCINGSILEAGQITIHGGTFENTAAASGAIFGEDLCAVVIDGGRFVGNQLLTGIVWWSTGEDLRLEITGGNFTEEMMSDIRTANELGDAEYARITDLKLYSLGKIKDRIYTGKGIKPVPQLSVRLNDTDEPYDLETLDWANKRFGYKATYKNNTNIGTATVTIKGDGEVKGTKTATFRILPGKAKLKSVKKGKKAFTVKIAAQKGGVSYQVQYRLGKGKWKARTTTKTSLTIKKLKS